MLFQFFLYVLFSFFLCFSFLFCLCFTFKESDTMNNMLEQDELSEIISTLTQSTWRGAGQSGRANGLMPLIGKDTVLQLWQDGYRDWQISQVMSVKLSVIQDCLINNSIDYKSRALPIDKNYISCHLPLLCLMARHT